MRVVHYTHLLVLICALLLVTACASEKIDKKPKTEVFPSGYNPDAAKTGAISFDSTGALQDAKAGLDEKFTAADGTTYADMAQAQSSGSVQIFPLDQPASAAGSVTGAIEATTLDPSANPSAPAVIPSVQTINQHTAPPQGVAYSGDSNVTIFPLDDGGSVTETGNFVPPGTAMAMNGFGYQNNLRYPYPSLSNNGMANFGGLPPGNAEKIYFSNGSADLTPLMDSLIEQLAIEARQGRMIRVEGHASRRAKTRDPIEARIVNLRVSMQRALAVSQALIRKGVPAPSIRTTALGDSQPPSSEKPSMTPEAAARRVEVFAQ